VPSLVAPSAIVHPWVVLPDDARIEPFAILGQPAAADPDGAPTTFGPGLLVRSHTVIYAANRVGGGFQTGHGALIREANEIGDRVSVGSHTVIEHHVTIGDRVRIHSDAFVPEFSVLEDDAWIGPAAVLTNARYPTSAGAKRSLEGPRIGARARLGANATVLPGVVVGAEALVGAGAVVTQDVPPGAVVVGNPARIIGHVRDLDAYDHRAMRGEGR
jgi:acetyltransferase-like isoleucine patch superfamily enzyme